MKPGLYQEIGELIKIKRETKLRVTQEEFAKRAGVSRPSVANIEKGRQQLTVGQLLLFSSVLGVNPMELIPNVDDGEVSNSLAEALPPDLDPKLRAWVETVQGS